MFTSQQDVEWSETKEEIYSRVSGHKNRFTVTSITTCRRVKRKQSHSIKLLEFQKTTISFTEFMQVFRAGSINWRSTKLFVLIKEKLEYEKTKEKLTHQYNQYFRSTVGEALFVPIHKWLMNVKHECKCLF